VYIGILSHYYFKSCDCILDAQKYTIFKNISVEQLFNMTEYVEEIRYSCTPVTLEITFNKFIVFVLTSLYTSHGVVSDLSNIKMCTSTT